MCLLCRCELPCGPRQKQHSTLRLNANMFQQHSESELVSLEFRICNEIIKVENQKRCSIRKEVGEGCSKSTTGKSAN